MYKQEIQHKIIFEVVNDIPSIKIAIRFNDLFTKDTYVLVSEQTKNFNKNDIGFNLVINNNKQTGTLKLKDLNCLDLLNESFSNIVDYDFKSFFTDELKREIEMELKDYLSQYENQIVLNEIGIAGELQRMKELS